MNEDINSVIREETIEDRIVTTEETKKNKNRKTFSILKIIINIIFFALLLAFIASAIVGYLNMQAINENKEPVWCMSESVQENKDQIKRTCDIGVFKIVKTETSKETVVSLKPFFIAD